MTLLHVVRAGDVTAVKAILREGPARPGELRTGLAIAVCGGHEDLVAALLDAGANPDEPAEGEQWGPLHLAVEHGKTRIVATLVARGANIDQRDEAGFTPLHLAVDVEADSALQAGTSPSTRVIELLLSLGADPCLEDRSGDIPLSLAKRYEFADAVRVLNRAIAIGARH